MPEYGKINSDVTPKRREQTLRIIILLGMVMALAGCAHPVNISPNAAVVTRSPDLPPRVRHNVGFFLPLELMNLEVTTPGGGGDSVRYFPYRDMESGYQYMLSNVFENVVRLSAVGSAEDLARQGVKVVVTPTLVTNSGSTNTLTWSPTHFTVDLTSQVRDASGKSLGNPRVVGNGRTNGALITDFDFGKSGRLAMEDALRKMQQALLEIKYEPVAPGSVAPAVASAPAPRLTSGFVAPAISSSMVAPAMSSGFVAPSPNADNVTARLEKLKQLFDRKLINREAYQQKKKEILEGL
ncbi:SHOCT domain-containing protein [Azohydromonas aeria]|uniref:SHOCT domain-containing protein n=1 Tax=Azohydromonas aeria TaxID=2590212 RepID=UPI0012F89F6A|nr:SHOCT domain-containing protein [Azohydromonas aeria]